MSSTHSNPVEAVPAFPAGGVATSPTTLISCNEQLLSNKDLTQQHVVRSTAVTASVLEAVPCPLSEEQARPESCFVWLFSSDIQSVPLGPCSAQNCNKKARFHCGGCESSLLIAYCSKACQNRVWRTHRTVCFSTRRGVRSSFPPTLRKGGTPPCTNGQLSCHVGRVGSKVQCSNCKQSFCSRLCLKSMEHGHGCGSWQPPPSLGPAVLTKRRISAGRPVKRLGFNPYVFLALEATEDCSDSSGSEFSLHHALPAPVSSDAGASR